MQILITGGAGYIGSIIAEELLRQNYRVIIIDNLSQGHKKAVHPDAEFMAADLCNIHELESIFTLNQIDAVMHMAAETVVEYSSTQPIRFFQNNVNGGVNLLSCMLKYNVKKIIFSSTAAVYGETQTKAITEDHPKEPINVYGLSKLMFESILEKTCEIHDIRYITFRYFNAAGASELYGEDHRPETHLIPNILKTLYSKDNCINVYGIDYPTADGSCIRDYVHVLDIAQAHILALKKIDKIGNAVFNLGNGNGYSVLDIIREAKNITGADAPVKICPRRPGDPVKLMADSSKARATLGWSPRFSSINNIIKSAWDWKLRNPDGYSD